LGLEAHLAFIKPGWDIGLVPMPRRGILCGFSGFSWHKALSMKFDESK
jgi:hypothetical protein